MRETRFLVGDTVEWRSSVSGALVTGVVTGHEWAEGVAQYSVLLLTSYDGRDRRGASRVLPEPQLAPGGSHKAIDGLDSMLIYAAQTAEDEQEPKLAGMLRELLAETRAMRDDDSRREALQYVARQLMKD